jgi:ClpP class serine protease
MDGCPSAVDLCSGAAPTRGMGHCAAEPEAAELMTAYLHGFVAGAGASKRRLGGLASLALVTLGLLGLLLSMAPFATAQTPQAKPIVYVLPIEGVIDLGLAPFVKRVIDEATEAGAAALVLKIDTFGGRVDAAVQIRDALLNAELRTVGLVDKRAISAAP